MTVISLVFRILPCSTIFYTSFRQLHYFFILGSFLSISTIFFNHGLYMVPFKLNLLSSSSLYKNRLVSLSIVYLWHSNYFALQINLSPFLFGFFFNLLFIFWSSLFNISVIYYTMTNEIKVPMNERISNL